MAENAGHANLRPNPGGEVRNPKGHNQYTYRKDAEATFDRILRSVADRGKMTVAEAILSDVAAMSQERDKWAIDKVLERILPAVQKHEVELPGVESDALDSAIARFRSNGKSEIPARTNGGGST
jgi:hypothetical protein